MNKMMMRISLFFLVCCSLVGGSNHSRAFPLPPIHKKEIRKKYTTAQKVIIGAAVTLVGAVLLGLYIDYAIGCRYYKGPYCLLYLTAMNAGAIYGVVRGRVPSSDSDTELWRAFVSGSDATYGLRGSPLFILDLEYIKYIATIDFAGLYKYGIQRYYAVNDVDRDGPYGLYN